MPQTPAIIINGASAPKILTIRIYTRLNFFFSLYTGKMWPGFDKITSNYEF